MADNGILTRRQFIGTAATAATFSCNVRAQRPPNIILIYVDDLGYGDLGCYGSSIPTPEVDRLAKEGVRFSDFYSASPVCSPSRAALLTGRYPTRVNVPRVLFPRDTTGLPRDELTIAELLKRRQYRTMCIGKWHLGHQRDYLPTRRGFDHYFGIPYSNDMTPCILMRDEKIIEDPAKQETLTQRYTEEAIQFIKRSKDQPFFLYLPHTFVHIPLYASARFRGRSPLGLYGDALQEIDWSVGEIRRTLEQEGLEENTLVLFSSDNGPWYQGSTGGLRGRKGTTWEGGMRVPFIAWWPGRIPASGVCRQVATTMDLLPTIVRLTGAPMPAKKLDGIDIWPLLSGQRRSLQRDLFLYFDHWHVQCARWGRWKIHIARYNAYAYGPVPPGGKVNYPLAKPELYDLLLDPSESYDVADEHPEIVQRMVQRIEELVAGFPKPVRRAYRETKARKVRPYTSGALPRPLKT